MNVQAVFGPQKSIVSIHDPKEERSHLELLQRIETLKTDLYLLSNATSALLKKTIKVDSVASKIVPVKEMLPLFRDDGRCGPNFPAPGAPEYGQCDPYANV